MLRFRILCFIVICCSFLLFSLPVVIQAADFQLTITQSSVETGQSFIVSFLLDSENDSVNVLEASLSYNSNQLQVQELRSGDSIISLWLKRPEVTSAGTIKLSGAIPGGYNGSTGLIVSIVFKSLKVGQATIEINQASALLNDGKGTAAEVNLIPLTLSITVASTPSEVAVPTVPLIQDNTPPEFFEPELISMPDLSNGQWALIFAAKDKGSGVDYYQVQEATQQTPGDIWQIVDSPYILQDQSLNSYIFVKAFDKYGNERLVVLAPSFSKPWYKNYQLWLIVIAIVIVILPLAVFIRVLKK